MTFQRLLLRSLLFHWRGNVAVGLGVVVGTAVLTGALLVGNSLRGSLQALALDQLGWVDVSLVAGRFFREELASPPVANAPGSPLPVTKVCPALLLQSSAASVRPEPLHANKVMIFAVDDRFWPPEDMPLDTAFWHSMENGVVLNRALANRLEVGIGDKLTLLLQKADNVPRETLVGTRKRDDVLSKLNVTVKAILADTGMGRFTMRPSPQPPLNAFVPLRLIQEQRDPDTKKAPLHGRVNALFIAGSDKSLPEALHQQLTLEDWNLELTTPEERARSLFKLLAMGDDRQEKWKNKLRPYRWKQPVLRVPETLAKQANDKDELTLDKIIGFYRQQHGYLNLTSSQVFIDPYVVRTAAKVATQLGWRSAPTLAYMVDTLSDGTNEAAYVIAAALDPGLPPPLGPLKPADLPPLQDDEILLAQWPKCPLKPAPGQLVTLVFDVPDAAGNLVKHTEKMKFAGWVPLQGVADDPDLTPRFEGITDQLSIREWSANLPFEINRSRITPADHQYWDRYRATPKVYVSLATGQRLWGSRFGQVTSLRLAPGESPGAKSRDAETFRRELLADLQPEQGGFVLENVKQQALAAGQGSSDFGGLFLGFSCFLIVAALLLVGLMFRLSLDQRASEMGLLLAIGWRRSTVRWLALAEGTAVAAIGALLGIGAAILYAALLLDYLGVLWPGGLDRSSFLHLHVNWLSCVIGYGTSLLVSVLTIWWATRVLAKVAPRALLAGETVAAAPPSLSRLRLSVALLVIAPFAAVACVIIGAMATDHEAQAGSFFGSGIFVLTALLAALWWWMRRSGHAQGRPMPGLVRLGMRNAARHPVRSLLTVGLLAAATFIVVAVQVFHRDAGQDFLEKSGGSGGYAWIGEATVPLFQDLNTPAGRAEARLPPDLDAQFVALRMQAGDDASCLNLYQPRQPRLLGAPQALIERGGFHFAASESEAKNPWQLLMERRNDGAIPAIGEATTVQWMLHSGLGKEIKIRDGRGQEVRLRIVALLQDSVFQGELLIADGAFLKLFPQQQGCPFFLIDAPPKEQGQPVRRAVESALADYGFSMTPAQERLQSYLDVENTYLATFQALGGLGLLLGTLGLAVVLVRSVWERRGELALLRALGFRRSALGWLVLAENVWLLALGLVFGCAAALMSIAPFVASQAGDVFQPRLLVLMGLVVVVGLACGGVAVSMTLRTPLLPALRRE